MFLTDSLFSINFIAMETAASFGRKHWNRNRILVNLIPIIRNEHSWIEYVISGLVSGTLAGHMFSDRDALGFEKTTKPKRISYKQLCLLRGVGYGLLIGTVSGAYTHFSKGHLTASDLRKWEKYWKQRRQVSKSIWVSMFFHLFLNLKLILRFHFS